MRKMIWKILFTLLAGLMIISSTAFADNIEIKFDDFILQGSGSIATNGTSATLYDALLTNDPGYGDPGLVIPENVLSLNFTYDFTEFDDDEFTVWVWEYDTVADVALDDVEYEFIVDTEAGLYSIDLTGLNPAADLLGMEFGLTIYGDAGTQSVEMSSMYFVTEDAQPSPTPEPTTFVLFGIGLLGLAGASRNKALL